MTQKTATLDLPTFGKTVKQAAGRAVDPEVLPVASPARPAVVAEVPTATAPTAALPSLPRGKRPSFSRHRNEANATRAVELLVGVQETVAGWHQALRQVLADIQAVYQSGPMVEGWLEAIATPPATGGATEPDAALLRHGDPAQLAAYVERLSQGQPPVGAGGKTQYRLCSLDADGRLQCQPCPPEQLGVISQAIARHQQLRQLLHQKQLLENRLKQAADALEQVHQTLGLSSTPAP